MSHLNVAQEAVITASLEPRRDKVSRVNEITWWWGRVCNRVRKGAWVALRNHGSSRAWGQSDREFWA